MREVNKLDYSNYTKEQLIEIIDELMMLNKQLLLEKSRRPGWILHGLET